MWVQGIRGLSQQRAISCISTQATVTKCRPIDLEGLAPIPESVLLVTSGRACQAPFKFDEANVATPDPLDVGQATPYVPAPKMGYQADKLYPPHTTLAPLLHI
jgi:hypothetical protein